MNLTQIDLAKLSDDELIVWRIAIEKELRVRKIRFNVGEIGEKLAIKYFNETPGLPNLLAAPTGAKNVDALSRDGDRYTIKPIQRGHKTGTIYPDADDEKKQLFEYLLLVHLNENFDLESLYRFSWNQFVTNRSWDSRMNAWYIQFSGNKIQNAEQIFNRNDKTN